MKTTIPAKKKRTGPVGPATGVAIVLALLIGFYNYKGLLPEKQRTPPPAIDRKTLTPRPPLIEPILAAEAKLGLSSSQTSALRILSDKWASESKPILDELNEKARELEKFMNSSKRISMSEIKQHSEPFSETSARFAELRSLYDKRSLSILTPAQRTEWLSLSQPKGKSNENDRPTAERTNNP